MLFILFCKCLPTFPSVFNVPLPSACSCRATRRKSLCDPPAAANSFARCVRLPGEKAPSGPRETARRVAAREGKRDGRKVRRTVGLFRVFSGPNERASGGPGLHLGETYAFPLVDNQRASWDPRVPLRGPRWLVFRGSVALTRRPPPFPAALLQRKVLCVLSAHSPVSRPSLVPRPVSDSALSLVSQQLHTSLPGG